MSREHVFLTTVIATKGRPELLRRTLLSIKDACKPPGYRGVIVVENGPEQLVKAFVETEDWGCPVHYYYLREAHKSKALNVALEEVREGLVYFNDDDVRLEKNTLTAVHAVAQNLQGKFFLGGPVGVEYEKKPPAWLKQYCAYGDGWAYPSLSVAQVSEACFLGANWVAAAEDVRRVGGFPVRFGPTQPSKGEDTKVQRLLMAAGILGYYVPDARVWHYVSWRECTPQSVLHEGYRRSFSAAIFDDCSLAMRCAALLKNCCSLVRDSFLWVWFVMRGNASAAFFRRYTINCRFGDAIGRLQSGWRHP